MGIQTPAEVKFALIYEAIQQDDNELSILSLCGIAGVSRSGYYAWIKAAPIRQRRDDQDRADFWQETDTWQWMSYVGNFSDSFLTWYTGECGCEIPDVEKILDMYPTRE